MAKQYREGKFQIEARRDGMTRRWYPTIDGDDTGRDYGTLEEARLWCKAAAIAELKDALRAALDWIDAVPRELAAQLPAMPGFDRDDAEMLLED